MVDNSKQQALALAMRSGMRRLASGVSVLSSRDDTGLAHTMTVSSVTSVSDAPSSLLVCVNRDTKIAPIMTLGRNFTINVLGMQHQDVSIACSTGLQTEERLKVGKWINHINSPPYLEDAEARFLCEITGIYPHGSHDIIVGDIVEVKVSEQPVNALVYADGGYHTLTKIGG